MVQLRGIEELSFAGLLDQDIKNFVNELVKVGLRCLACAKAHNYTCCVFVLKNIPKGWPFTQIDLVDIIFVLRRPVLTQEETTSDMWSRIIILEDDVIVSNTLFIEKVSY